MNGPLRATVCFCANDAQKSRAKLLTMLRAPISSRKTIGWLLLVGLLVLFASMGLGTSFAAPQIAGAAALLMAFGLDGDHAMQAGTDAPRWNETQVAELRRWIEEKAPSAG